MCSSELLGSDIGFVRHSFRVGLGWWFSLVFITSQSYQIISNRNCIHVIEGGPTSWINFPVCYLRYSRKPNLRGLRTCVRREGERRGVLSAIPALILAKGFMAGNGTSARAT